MEQLFQNKKEENVGTARMHMKCRSFAEKKFNFYWSNPAKNLQVSTNELAFHTVYLKNS